MRKLSIRKTSRKKFLFLFDNAYSWIAAYRNRNGVSRRPTTITIDQQWVLVNATKIALAFRIAHVMRKFQSKSTAMRNRIRTFEWNIHDSIVSSQQHHEQPLYFIRLTTLWSVYIYLRLSIYHQPGKPQCMTILSINIFFFAFVSSIPSNRMNYIETKNILFVCESTHFIRIKHHPITT